MDRPSSGPRAPALRLAAYISAGILSARALGLPPWLLWPGILLLTSLLVSLLLLRGHRNIVDALLPPVAGALCICMGALRFSETVQSASILESTPRRTSVVVEGAIADEPVSSGGRCRFPLEYCRSAGPDAREIRSERLLVTVRLAGQPADGSALRYGDRVLLRGRIERPSTARNPGEFDARAYYEANGISMFLRVRSIDSIRVLDRDGGDWWMRTLVLPVRRFLLRHIDRTIAGDEGEFLKGIMIGERSGLTYSLREGFVRSGTAHVLAVSGSNVAVIAVIAFMVLQFLRTGRWLRAVLTCLCIIFYMLLTGGQPPVVRAGIMAIIILGAGLVQERPNTMNSLGLAAVAIMLFDPRQLFDVGFQLSFAAVLSIVVLYPLWRVPIDRWTQGGGWWLRAARGPLRLVALSLAATVGTLPLMAIWFGRVSIIGLVANIVVVPAVGVSVVLGVASGVAATFSEWVAGSYAALNTVILRITIWTAQATGASSFATIETPSFRWVDAIAFYALVGLFLSRRRSLYFATVVALLAFHLAVHAPAAPFPDRTPGSMRVTFLDVGQGDAILIEMPDGRTMLIDAGGRSPEYDAGERVVVPYLRRCGIGTIDALVVTHPHSDHIGGVPAVLRSFPVRTLMDAGNALQGDGSLVELLKDSSMARRILRAGTTVPAGLEARVFVISPGPDLPAGQDQAAENNGSAVLKVCFGSVAFLLAGDAGLEAEDAMVSTYGGFLRSTVLKVGHHGSTGSSSEQFLNTVRPACAVISVGSGNAFGHPSEVILGRLKDRGIEILRTDEEGAVIFETDGTHLRRVNWK